MLPRLTTAVTRPALHRLPLCALRTAPRPRLYASAPPGSDNGSGSFPSLPPGFEKVAHSPTALAAIQNLVELMKKNGVDLTSGEKPSVFTLMKLATNSEVKTATSKVMEELKNAGVDVSPERLQSIMNSQGDFFKGKKD